MGRQVSGQFSAGDRIVYEGEYIGTLVSPVGAVGGLEWVVEWEDGADTTGSSFPQAKMKRANGGAPPGSSRHSEEWKALVDASEELGKAVALWQNARDAYVAKYPKEKQ
jgi:hypothetical protein